MQENKHWIQIKDLVQSSELSLLELDLLLDQLKAFYADVCQQKQMQLDAKLQTSEVVVSHTSAPESPSFIEAVDDVDPNEVIELSIPIPQPQEVPKPSFESPNKIETTTSNDKPSSSGHIHININNMPIEENEIEDDTDEFVVEDAIKPTETFSIKNLFGLKNQKTGVIKAQLGINDRLLMANTFFNGNEQLFYAWLEHIEKVQSWDEAYEIFKTDIEKPSSEAGSLESKAYELLELLLKKFFSNRSL